MKQLFEHQVIRQNLPALIGISLCFYFCYHLIQGERSYLRLYGLEKRIERLGAEYDILHRERAELERKVVMLRPGSLDTDLLEERVRIMLGYGHPDDHILLERD